MATKNALFTFKDMSDKDKAVKNVLKSFTRAGTPVVSYDVDSKIKRQSGIAFRTMTLTFADSQTVAMRVKETGDIFEVLVNGKILPIKNQDDHVLAVGEITNVLIAGRAKFQAKLAKQLTKVPPTMKTAAPKLLDTLVQRRDELKVEIQSVRDQIEQLNAA